MKSFISKLIDNKGLTGFFAIAVVAVVVFLFGNQPTLYILEEQKLSDAPDFFLEGVTVKSYDKSGLLVETVVAQSANHYVAQQTTLEQPVITKVTENIKSVAEAETGVINDTDNTITLNQSAVVARFINSIESGRVQANTILFNDRNQTILGQGNSALKTPQGTTLADSIFYNLTDNTATLNGGVSGHYDVTN
ncbi:LPS export ABC transporter periplasmic protein LptC [Marinomonas ostreistagni]|uniref:LPS export ABC transporter periplasmic protein LptC n=1 Tax=Marinomonas ostreistagni TaxID=359209 RepID=A0ABS0Z7B7_9GAMM|nr:LPS export ABC transporter periplasmic protein LptC [Marinomonas ostreistagni]MBJ7549555.1 LPS export ABC transporter periplasmic protein LptC [Marinomonas ostreistagni]